MKISKLIFAIAIASTFLVSSCRDTKTESTNGHEHDADGNHMDDETIGQEEFHVDKDSMKTMTGEHGHEHDADGNHSNDDDSEHHDH